MLCIPLCGSECCLPLALSLMQQLDPPQKEQLLAALTDMDLQLRKLADIPWLWQLMEPSDEEVITLKHRSKTVSLGAVLVS